MIDITAVICPNCQSFLYPRVSDGDTRSCPCNSITIVSNDGQIKVFTTETINPEDVKTCQLEVNTTSEKLYEDWKYQIDVLGLMRNVFYTKKNNDKEKPMLPIIYKG